MPITKNGYEYQMPDGIRDLLTNEFLQSFHKQFSSWYKKKHDMKDDEFDYVNFYIHSEGNGVWQDSFETSCKLFSMEWLSEYYRHLAWYEADLFVGEVGETMVQLEVIKEGVQHTDEEEEKEVNINGSSTETKEHL